MDARVALYLSAKSTDEGKTNSCTAVVHVQKYSSTEKHEKKLLLRRGVEDSSNHDRKVTDMTELEHELKSNLRGSNHTLSEEVVEQMEETRASSSMESTTGLSSDPWRGSANHKANLWHEPDYKNPSNTKLWEPDKSVPSDTQETWNNEGWKAEQVSADCKHSEPKNKEEGNIGSTMDWEARSRNNCPSYNHALACAKRGQALLSIIESIESAKN